MTANENSKLDNILYRFKVEAKQYSKDDAMRDIRVIIDHNYQRSESTWVKLCVTVTIAAAVIGYAIGHTVVHVR